MLPFAARREATLTERIDNANRGRFVPWIWSVPIALVGAIDTWGSRFNLNPDGISYIEMARHAVAGARDGLINGYWSPGYPALLMPVTAIAGRDAAVAVPLLHLVNLLLFVIAGCLFLSLVARTAADVRESHAAAPWSRYVMPLATAAFLLFSIKGFGLGLLTPDMSVMLAVLATVWACRRMERTPDSWRGAVILGVVLAAGYWLKGIMLPLNAALLLGLLIVPPSVDRGRAKIAVAAVVFVLLCLPLVALVSARVGRITMGEVGRLNYAWEVDGVTQFVGWAGDSTGRLGAPIHPPQVLLANPRTLEFSRPFSATYPLWFDASYWYAGIRPRFDAAGQWRVLKQGLHDVGSLVHQLWLLPVTLLALWLTSTKQDVSRSFSRLDLVLGGWSIVGALLYAMVHVEPRYLAGFVGTILLVVWAALASRTPRRATAVVMVIAALAMAVSVTMHIVDNTGGYQASYRPGYVDEARQMNEMGIAANDHLAMVGDAFEAYAAFAANASITAQVMDSTGYWTITPAARSELGDRLAASGVVALLANNVAEGMVGEGWRLIAREDGANLGVLMLHRR